VLRVFGPSKGSGGLKLGHPPRNMGLQAKEFGAKPRTLFPEAGPAPSFLGKRSGGRGGGVQPCMIVNAQ
jgi:hypothetical protein